MFAVKKWHPWPVAIITFFVVLFCAEAFLITNAIANHPALSVESPYQHGLHYQEVIDRLQRAEQAQLKADFILEPYATEGNIPRSYEVQVSVRPETAVSIHPTISLHLARANTDAFDAHIVLRVDPEKPGVYKGVIAAGRSGFWNAALEMGEGKNGMRLETQLTFR